MPKHSILRLKGEEYFIVIDDTVYQQKKDEDIDGIAIYDSTGLEVLPFDNHRLYFAILDRLTSSLNGNNHDV